MLRKCICHNNCEVTATLQKHTYFVLCPRFCATCFLQYVPRKRLNFADEEAPAPQQETLFDSVLYKETIPTNYHRSFQSLCLSIRLPREAHTDFQYKWVSYSLNWWQYKKVHSTVKISSLLSSWSNGEGAELACYVTVNSDTSCILMKTLHVIYLR
jgi:hypothetical protein